MAYQLKEGIVPVADEAICLISYLIALTRVGGGPDERTGFWPAYREALNKNVASEYRNPRIEICRPILNGLLRKNPSLANRSIYYREGKLTEEICLP